MDPVLAVDCHDLVLGCFDVDWWHPRKNDVNLDEVRAAIQR